jgi:hypothetical protein
MEDQNKGVGFRYGVSIRKLHPVKCMRPAQSFFMQEPVRLYQLIEFPELQIGFIPREGRMQKVKIPLPVPRVKNGQVFPVKTHFFILQNPLLGACEPILRLALVVGSPLLGRNRLIQEYKKEQKWPHGLFFL